MAAQVDGEAGKTGKELPSPQLTESAGAGLQTENNPVHSKPEKSDPIMQYVEKLEQWRQGKLDKFDVDPEYREARLMKHGTRTGFEEFLDRTIEKQCRKMFSTPNQKPSSTAKAEQPDLKSKQDSKGSMAGTSDPVQKTLSAFEKMAEALKKGMLGATGPPKSKENAAAKQELDAAEGELIWNGAESRMDSDTQTMWNFLATSPEKRAEVKKRFMLALQTGVPAMFSDRPKGSALNPLDQDNILHGMIRAAHDEAKGTGDGLDDGETNVLKKFQTQAEQEAVAKEIAAREAAEAEQARAEHGTSTPSSEKR